MDYITQYNSPLGGITLASDGEALTGVWFDDNNPLTSSGRVNENYNDNENGNTFGCEPIFEETKRWLDEYFAGRENDFTPPLSLRGTAFQLRVWKELLSIPYGKTVSYGELANRLGVHSAQAIGGAVGRNPVAIIVPCHRVIGADGSLTGYAGGIGRKKKLLELESQKRQANCFIHNRL